MTAKMSDLNGFRALATLAKVAQDPRVEEIEGGGMDEGRVFIHLRPGYWFGSTEQTHSKSVGSAADCREYMKLVEHCPCCVPGVLK